MTTWLEISESDRTLHDAAREAARNAYVPYSSFPVGAAIRCADGSVITGCNVENASFGLTICAERAAVARAVAEHGASQFTDIAVYADAPDGQPCGMCRQVLVEFAPQMRVVFQHHGELVAARATDLLPGTFVPAALQR